MVAMVDDSGIITPNLRAHAGTYVFALTGRLDEKLKCDGTK
jgi:hypothetical protein